MAAPRNSTLQEVFAKRLRAFLFATSSGVPPWLDKIASGEGPGLYQPTDAPWVIHAELGTLVAGVRALLMQALHPGSLAGVHAHSRYQSDLLGRLAGTIRWLTVTTFAPHEAVAEEAARINHMHHRVRGEYHTASGETRAYRAADPDLLRWVHLAFMDSFLRSHQLFCSPEIPGGADAYVRLWAQSVAPLGLRDVPLTEAAMQTALEGYQSELAVNDQTREVIRWLRHPPLPRGAIPMYNVLFQAALSSLPAEYRKLLQLRSAPLWLMRPVTRILLKLIRAAIGPENVLADAAIARMARTPPPPLAPLSKDRSPGPEAAV